MQTVDDLSTRTRIEKDKIQYTLDRLQEMGLALRKGSLYLHSGLNIHVPRGSAYNKMNHFNWRLRGIDKSNDENSLHYTTLFSISKSDWLKIKQQLLQFIEKQRKEIQSSGSEEVYCFCCDLFSP